MSRGPAWKQVVACLILQGVSGGTISSAYGVLAVPYGAEFDTSRMVVMLGMTVTLLATAILSPFAGGWMEKWSMRGLMLFGSIALTLGFLAISVATSFTQILVIYGVLIAPANVLIGPLAASVLLARWFDKNRGRALGIAAVGLSLGGFLFPPLIQSLIEAIQWRPALQVLAAIVAILTLAAWFVVVDRPHDKSGNSPIASAGGGQPVPVGEVLRSQEFWLMAAVFGVLLTGMLGLVTNMVPLARDRGIALSTATLLIASLSFGSLLGKVIFAVVADRLEPRTLLMVGVTGFFAGILCFWTPGASFGLLAAGAGIVGLANGGALPLQTILVARTYGLSSVGRIVGLLSLVISLFCLATPPLFGLIYDRTGSYGHAFLSYLVLAVVALLLTTRIAGAQRVQTV